MLATIANLRGRVEFGGCTWFVYVHKCARVFQGVLGRCAKGEAHRVQVIVNIEMHIVTHEMTSTYRGKKKRLPQHVDKIAQKGPPYGHVERMKM